MPRDERLYRHNPLPEPLYFLVLVICAYGIATLALLLAWPFFPEVVNRQWQKLGLL